MSNHSKISAFVCALMLMLTSGCQKLSYNPDPDDIKFDGIRSIILTKEGHVIVAWENPPADSRPVEKFEIFVSELDGQEGEAVVEGSGPAEGSGAEAAAAFRLQGGNDLGIIVDMLEASSPVVKGKVVGAVTGGTTYTIEGLSSGKYAFQVKAMDSTGARDVNTKVMLFTIDEVVRFSGIESAEISGDKVLIKWSPFVTTIKGEAIHYIVYEGITFADKEKIAIVAEDKTFFEIPLSEKAPGSVWTYGVRVKDTRGIVDNNVTLKTIQIPEDNSEYIGCISGVAKGATHITVEVEFPKGADKVNVYRNGRIVFTSVTAESVIFDDRDGLQEGVKYTYKCESDRLGFKKMGTSILEVTTLNSNPPTFSGILNVTADGSDKAKVSWGVATGVPAQYFAIFASPGQNVDWGSEPIATVEASKLDTVVTNLGDELPYSFGARACTAADICDTNTVSIILTLPDGGPPKTVGATDAKVVDGKMNITAPWKHSDGAVLKRKIYVYTGTTDVQNFAKYTLRKTVVVNDLIKPDTTLVLENLIENTQYNIIVRDEGPTGNTNENMNIVSKNSGDLAPPSFGGITSLVLGPDGQKETALTAGFSAIAPEVLDPTGASYYIVYLKEGGGNACANGVKHVEFTASAYTAGQNYEYIITGLKPKTMYSVCLKAKDSGGNISLTDGYLSKSTIDTTPPIFDGIQSLNFNQDIGLLNAGWNGSPSEDAYEYVLQIWKNVATPGEFEILKVTKGHPAFKDGFKFDSSVFSFGSGDTVYIVVDACDNAGFIPGGKQNCTKYPLSSAMMITLADIEPPPGFAGIGAENMQLTPAEGVITVTWVAPADWTDYRGFKIYIVDNNGDIEFVKQCPCTAAGCPDQPTSCDLSGLDPFRTYNLHVRAYDEAGNLTILDPFTRSTTKQTSDTTPPTFNSNLALLFEAGFSKLTWNMATDNQYAMEPESKIEYLVYRKTGSAFGNLSAPEIDGELLKTTEEARHDDNKNFASGVTYFYTVCAQDGTGNRSCDANVKNVTTPDLIPPTISSFTTNKQDEDKTWSLSWVVSDNMPNPLLVKVYKTTSENAPGPATEIDSVVAADYNIVTVGNLIGPKNQDVYVNYLLVVEDQAGNKSTASLSVFSQNYIEVTAVKSNEGTSSGGKLVVLEGKGFHSSTVVKFGGSGGVLCTGTERITKTILICTTPASLVGNFDVYVENSDNSSHKLLAAYSFCTTGSCVNICNNPGLWGANFAKGNGLSNDPYIVCNDVHLNNVRFYANGKYVEFGDNVDLKAYTANDFLPLTTNANGYFYAFLDGKGHVVANYKYAPPPGTNGVGLIAYLAGSYDIRNIGMVNADVSGNYYVGGLLGYCNSATSTLENVFVTGKVTATDEQVGAIVGRGSCNLINAYASAEVSGSRYIGGLVGYKDYTGAQLSFSGKVTGSAEGTDCYVGGLVGRWGGNGQELDGISSDAEVTCTAVGANYTGGLLGSAGSLTIKNASFTGKVFGQRTVGGLVGTINASVTIDSSTSTGLINATGVYVGGLVGTSNGIIKNSSHSGDISTGAGYLGGLIGYLNSTVGGLEASHADGNFESTACCVGGLVGQVHQGTIKDSHSTGTVVSSSYGGGLVGYGYYLQLVIESSYSHSDVTVSGDYAGGLIGYVHYYTSVSNSYATGTIKGNNYIGGAFGRCRVHVNSPIQKTYATGDVEGTSNVGGFCGYMYDGYGGGPDIDITESFATGKVTGAGTSIGGFVGRMDNGTKIVKSYATGDVSGTNQVGGFLGYGYLQDMYIHESYATGDTTGDTNVGGFVGHFYSARYSRISDSYATGKVLGDTQIGGFAGASCDMVERVYAVGEVKRKIAGVGQAGGVVGIYVNNTTYAGLGSILSSYWNLETTKVASTYGGGTGLISADMKLQGSYQDWDFGTVWVTPETGPPILKWTTSP